MCDAAGRPLEDLIVACRSGGHIDPARFPVDAQLRVLPNHGCATAAQLSRYPVVDVTPAVDAVWERIAGW